MDNVSISPRRCGRYIVSVLLLAALPLGASAAALGTDRSPVSIASCDVTGSQSHTSMTDPNHVSFATMSIGFIDHAAVAATHVSLQIDYAGTRQRIERSGYFEPGATIEAQDVTSQLPAEASSPSCVVERVDFSDGSSWRAARQTASASAYRG